MVSRSRGRVKEGKQGPDSGPFPAKSKNIHTRTHCVLSFILYPGFPLPSCFKSARHCPPVWRKILFFLSLSLLSRKKNNPIFLPPLHSITYMCTYTHSSTIYTTQNSIHSTTTIPPCRTRKVDALVLSSHNHSSHNHSSHNKVEYEAPA